ncbi:hypothetical protein DFJ73DRAFT_39324 [Zopfochytrium polystomum]|nr:hypothetical protein DFJ73DRAFT_39324 [Zopfochytrium polystomum]
MAIRFDLSIPPLSFSSLNSPSWKQKQRTLLQAACLINPAFPVRSPRKDGLPMASFIPQPHPPSPPSVARTPRRQHRGHRRRRRQGTALQPSRKSSTSATPCTATPVGGDGRTMPAAELFWNERLEAMAGVLQSPKPSTPPPSQTGDAWSGGAGRERTGATSTKGCTGWWIALREGRLRDQNCIYRVDRGRRA